MLVHLFGAASSPSVLRICAKEIATNEEPNIPPEDARAIKGNFYVDNLFKLFDSFDEAIETISHLSRVLKFNGFHLTKFVSNRDCVMQTLPDGDRGAAEIVDLNLRSVKKAYESFGILLTIVLKFEPMLKETHLQGGAFCLLLVSVKIP